jgi:AraC-like DNA-binding protein
MWVARTSRPNRNKRVMRDTNQVVVPSGSLFCLRDLVHGREGSTKELAKEAGIPESWFYKSSITIPEADFLRAFETAKSMLKMPDLALQVTRFQNLNVLSEVLEVDTPSMSYLDLFCRFADNYNKLAESLSLTVTPEEGAVSVQYDSTSLATSNLCSFIEQGLAVSVQELRRAFGKDWQPLGAYFQHRPQFDAKLYQPYFGDNVFFNHDMNGIVIEDTLMARPVDFSLHSIKLNFSGRQQRTGRETTVYDVEKTVRLLLRSQQCNQSEVAAFHGLTVRGLQRRLKANGICFQDIMDAVRLDLTRKYLEYSDLKISEIAEILQYRHSLVLSRFFRSKTNMTPAEYRRHHNREADHPLDPCEVGQ